MDLRMVWNKCKSASILPVNHGFKGMKLKGLRMLVNFQLFNCWDIQPYSLVLVVMFTNRIRSQGPHYMCPGLSGFCAPGVRRKDGALVAWPHKKRRTWPRLPPINVSSCWSLQQRGLMWCWSKPRESTRAKRTKLDVTRWRLAQRGPDVMRHG